MDRQCSIDGCGKPARHRGWCWSHYARWKRNGDPSGMGTRNGEPLAFLLAAIERETDECIPWPYGTANGYGRVWFNGRSEQAHRVVLKQTQGEPPEKGMQAAHAPLICHNQLCINKRHLRWATSAENIADKAVDGTRAVGEANGSAKLTEDQVRVIRSTAGSEREIAKRFGISPGTVGRIRRGQGWRHVA